MAIWFIIVFFLLSLDSLPNKTIWIFLLMMRAKLEQDTLPTTRVKKQLSFSVSWFRVTTGWRWWEECCSVWRKEGRVRLRDEDDGIFRRTWCLTDFCLLVQRDDWVQVLREGVVELPGLLHEGVVEEVLCWRPLLWVACQSVGDEVVCRGCEEPLGDGEAGQVASHAASNTWVCGHACWDEGVVVINDLPYCM